MYILIRYTGSKPDDIAMQNVNTNYDNSKKVKIFKNTFLI